MKNLPVLSGWEPEALRDEARALRVRAQRVSEGAWCQGYAATDADGESAGPERDPSAVCFCAGTHIDYFTPHPILGVELIEQCVLTERTKRAGRWNIPSWNDMKGRKAYQVARAFRAAAARAERYAAILDRVPA